jgi:transposase
MLTSVEVRGKWVLSVEDWARRSVGCIERTPVRVIARVLGCSKNTVKKALAAERPPAYRRQPRGSVVDLEPRIRKLLQACPTMPATVIAKRIEWPYSIRTLSARVAELRPIYLPPDPASRTTYMAGEIAQCDFWFPPITLPVGFGQTRTATQLPVLTITPVMPGGHWAAAADGDGQKICMPAGGGCWRSWGGAAGAGVGR